MEITLKFYSDPSHGWLAVPKKYVDELNLWDKISSCSYMNGKTLYLEEDSDAVLFVNAAEDEGWKLNMTFKNTERNSRIRSYAPYRKENAHDIWGIDHYNNIPV